MPKDNFKDQCSDMTKEFNIQIPCRLAERIEAYAKENDADVTGIAIEALDAFLRWLVTTIIAGRYRNHLTIFRG